MTNQYGYVHHQTGGLASLGEYARLAPLTGIF
jgi:hypothetical protein